MESYEILYNETFFAKSVHDSYVMCHKYIDNIFV